MEISTFTSYSPERMYLSDEFQLVYKGNSIHIHLDGYENNNVYTYTCENGFRKYDIMYYILKSYYSQFPDHIDHENLSLAKFTIDNHGIVHSSTDS